MEDITLYRVRGEALRAGTDTFKAVREYLEGLSDEELEKNLVSIEYRKTKRPKKRELKIKLIVSRICQGDAFLQR